jgi:hypothetical protein
MRIAVFATLTLLLVIIRLVLPLIQMSSDIPYLLTQFLQITFVQENEIANTISSIGIFIIMTYVVYLIIASDIQYRKRQLHFSQITLLKIYDYLHKLEKNYGLKYPGSEYPLNHLILKIKTWKYHIIRIPILWSVTGVILAFLVYASVLYVVPYISMFSSNFSISGGDTISNSIFVLERSTGLGLESQSGSITDLVTNSNNHLSNVYYISGYGITVLDGYSHKILKLIPLNDIARHLAVNSNTSEVYVTTHNGLFVVDENYNIYPLRGLKFRGNLDNIAVDSRINVVYVTTDLGVIYAINGVTKNIVSNVTIGVHPKDIVVNPTTNMLD